MFCAFHCTDPRCPQDLHLTAPSPAPALDVPTFHFTKEKIKAVLCASGAMDLIYKTAFKCKAVWATALQTCKCENWLSSAQPRVAEARVWITPSEIKYTQALCKEPLQLFFSHVTLNISSPRVVLTGSQWGSWGCGAAGSGAHSGGCCCSCPAPPSHPQRAVPEQSQVTNVTNITHTQDMLKLMSLLSSLPFF